jgi:hypothetical protein
MPPDAKRLFRGEARGGLKPMPRQKQDDPTSAARESEYARYARRQRNDPVGVVRRGEYGPEPPPSPMRRTGRDVGLDIPVKGVGLTPREISELSDEKSVVRESEYARSPKGQALLRGAARAARSMRGRR